MAQSVEQARNEAKAAERRQQAAWAKWNASDSAEDMAGWGRACEEQRAAEERAADAADRWEAWEAAREDRHSDWWVASWSNARAA